MFALIWTTSWPVQKDLFLKFVIREIQSFCMKYYRFSLASCSKNPSFRTLYLHRGFSIPSLLRFRQLLEPMKKTYFQNSLSAKSKNFRMNTNFFPRHAIPKIPFFSYNPPTQWLHHTEFGLISTTPCPDQNDLFLNIFICELRKFSQISLWKTKFFPSKAISKIRLVLLSSNAGDTPYQVCFDLDNSLIRWKRPIFKIR